MSAAPPADAVAAETLGGDARVRLGDAAGCLEVAIRSAQRGGAFTGPMLAAWLREAAAGTQAVGVPTARG